VTGWIRRSGPAPAGATARARLLCLPHAGGAASAFRRWPRAAGPELEILAVQPPGRQDRVDEAPCRSVEEIAGGVADALDAWTDRPFAVFGHSFGAAVGLALTAELERRGAPAPALLVVAGAGARPSAAMVALGALDDDALLAELVRRGHAPAWAASTPEMGPLALAALRVDLEALAAYRPAHRPRVACPVYALAGDADPITPPSALRDWTGLTSGPVSTATFPGGHFFVREHQRAVVPVVARAVLAEVDQPDRRVQVASGDDPWR